MQIEKIVTGLNESAELIHKGNIARGFYDGAFDKDGFPIKNTGELLMLVVSELGEALEADRKNKQAFSALKSFLFLLMNILIILNIQSS